MRHPGLSDWHSWGRCVAAGTLRSGYAKALSCAVRPVASADGAFEECVGHPCDRCRTCSAGRCCRRDQPDFALPELSEWGGPIFGEFGVLNDEGERVEASKRLPSEHQPPGNATGGQLPHAPPAPNLCAPAALRVSGFHTPARGAWAGAGRGRPHSRSALPRKLPMPK